MSNVAEARHPFYIVNLKKEAVKKEAQENDLNPGGFLFGVSLFNELKKLGEDQVLKSIDLFETVGILGDN